MNARRSVRGVAALTAGAMLTVLAPVLTAEVPRWIAAPETQNSDHPLWVSIEEAAPNGSLRWELLHPSVHRRYRQHLDWNAPKPRSGRSSDPDDQPCAAWMNILGGSHSDSASPAALLDHAGVVYRGRVEDFTSGFLEGELGTMIEASIEEVLKPPPSGQAPDRILVFYRYAVVSLAEGHLCVADARKVTPRRGGTLILAPVAPEPRWPDYGIFRVRDAELFFETEGGVLSAPRSFGHLEMETGALVAALRAARGQEGSQ